MGILAAYLADYSSANRAGVFFIAAGFSFAQIVTVIVANLIQSGNDAAALAPRSVVRIICLWLDSNMFPDISAFVEA
jgi:cytosine/uracil/thiamine/allantoin permease